MTTKPVKVAQVGEVREQYVVERIDLIRRGYLSLIHFMVEGAQRPWELMERGTAVYVMPYDREKRMIYLLEQPRPPSGFARLKSCRDAVQHTLRHGTMNVPFTLNAADILSLDAPAGMLETIDKTTNEPFDPPETPAARAVLELEEESGFTITEDRLEEISSHCPSSGDTTSRHIAFFADVTGLSPNPRPPGDGDENIVTVAYTYQQAYDRLMAGGIESATLSVLLHRFFLEEYRRRHGDLTF